MHIRSGAYDVSIPPKYAVSQVVGFIKGKSAIHIARTYIGRKRNFVARVIGDRHFVTPQGMNVLRNKMSSWNLMNHSN